MVSREVAFTAITAITAMSGLGRKQTLAPFGDLNPDQL
jgi:hypothetical protein